MNTISGLQWLTIVILCLANFFVSVIVSILAPLYPLEAESKQVTAKVYGFVIGIYYIIMFIASPIYGKYMNSVGANKMFAIGIFIDGLFHICFGLLTFVTDTNYFIGLSFTIRILVAIGTAAFQTSTLTIIAREFPEAVASTFGITEIAWGAGALVGPVVSGYMVQIAGFYLPFVSGGSILILVSIISLISLPKDKKIHQESKSKGLAVLNLLLVPSISICAFAVMSNAFSLGFLYTSLESHLRIFSLTPVQMGLMFLVQRAAYAIMAPVWGRLADKVIDPIAVVIFGGLFVAVSFLLLGPAPFLMLPTSLNLCIGALVCNGIGMSAIYVAAFSSILKDTILSGYPDNLQTLGLASGFFTSVFALGCFIGPSVGGLLLDYIGFQWASVVPLTLCLLVANISWIYLCIHCKDKQYSVNT